MQENLGFVGLGKMGQTIAQRLLQATRGEKGLRVFDRVTDRMAPLVVQGAYRATHLGDVARPGGIVFTMVPDDQALLQVTVGEDGLLYQLGRGGVHISLSTISLKVAQQLARLYLRQGGVFLAAAVLGRPDAAEQGKLSVVVSGEGAAKERVRPFLSTIGMVFDLGRQTETALVAKLGANFLMGVNHEAQGQAAALVEACGLDRVQFLSLLSESGLFGGAVFEGYSQMIGARDFSNARFPVDYGLKDLRLARTVADEREVILSYADAPLAHLQAALDAGRRAEDWSVLSEFANQLL